MNRKDYIKENIKGRKEHFICKLHNLKSIRLTRTNLYHCSWCLIVKHNKHIDEQVFQGMV